MPADARERLIEALRVEKPVKGHDSMHVRARWACVRAIVELCAEVADDAYIPEAGGAAIRSALAEAQKEKA